LSETMILVINSGSSSIKMAVISMQNEAVIAEGLAERLGGKAAELSWRIANETGIETLQHSLCSADHDAAIRKMLALLFSRLDRSAIAAAGHRVVHGGEKFIHPALLDDKVIAEIESIEYLAPLHNPANLLCIRLLREQLPEIPHIAVFDTAFHHTMPERAARYAVPETWYRDYGLRRYGFHGTSHHYVAMEAASLLGLSPEQCSLITVHLGNGCSATAIVNGISVDTTMGMTPLEGLVMGTRSGNVDPGMHAYIARQSGMSLDEITSMLNHDSGLLGISELSNDMRTLLTAAENGNERAELAVEIFCYQLAKALAGLAVAAGPVNPIDAIVFTGGIGEHASEIRARTVKQLAILGTQLDTARNEQHGNHSGGLISASDSKIAIMVVATSEEKMIARYVRELTAQPE